MQWTDLNPAGGGEIRSWGDTTVKVFEWTNVPLWTTGTPSTYCSFEVQLKPADNSMLFLYEDVSTAESGHTHAAATIGVEDPTGKVGVEIMYSFDVSMQGQGVRVPAACHTVI